MHFIFYHLSTDNMLQFLKSNSLHTIVPMEQEGLQIIFIQSSLELSYINMIRWIVRCYVK